MTGSGATPGSLRSGWRSLIAEPHRILIPTLVLSTGGVVLHVLAQFAVGFAAGSRVCKRPYLDQMLDARCGPNDADGPLIVLVGLVLLYVVGQLVVTGLYRACLDVTDHVPARGPFRGWVTSRVIAAAALFGVLLGINTIFLVLPAIVLGFLIRYTPLFVIDQEMGPRQALLASTRFVTSNLRSELWFVTRAVGLLLGALVLGGVGLFAAVPVVLLAQTQRYRVAYPN